MSVVNGAILALDLAAATGWAWGAPGSVPEHGSKRLAQPGDELGTRFRNLRTWLGKMLAERPTTSIVIFEAPVAQMRGLTTLATMRALHGYPAIVEELLEDTGLAVREATVSDIRRHFLGRTTFKGPIAKRLTIEKCRRLGFNPIDDNAADALALWHYQCSLIDPRIAIETSPLFLRRAAS